VCVQVMMYKRDGKEIEELFLPASQEAEYE
jgi:hypothetical protein